MFMLYIDPNPQKEQFYIYFKLVTRALETLRMNLLETFWYVCVMAAELSCLMDSGNTRLLLVVLLPVITICPSFTLPFPELLPHRLYCDYAAKLFQRILIVRKPKIKLYMDLGDIIFPRFERYKIFQYTVR
jgi:hypothetical protein